MTDSHPFVSNELTTFLRRLVEEHMSDADFNVTRFARLSGMSRTDLHRKLTRHTGMSASAFVRYWRVQWAKELLIQHPDWPVCWVGYEVGFGSPSYFTRVFSAIEGIGPEVFRKGKLRGKENLEHI